MRGLRFIETKRARELRRRANSAERILWDKLKNRQIGGFKFVRQEPIGPYFGDFVCRACKLVIELDGDSHAADGRPEHDARRDAFLRGLGYRLLRFANQDVFEDASSVVATILRECETINASA